MKNQKNTPLVIIIPLVAIAIVIMIGALVKIKLDTPEGMSLGDKFRIKYSDVAAPDTTFGRTTESSMPVPESQIDETLLDVDTTMEAQEELESLDAEIQAL